MRARAASIARFLAVFGLLLHMAVPMAHVPPQFAAPRSALSAHDAADHSAHGHQGDDELRPKGEAAITAISHDHG